MSGSSTRAARPIANLWMILGAASLVPAAWALAAREWSIHLPWVLAAGVATAAVQWIAAALIARKSSGSPGSFARAVTGTSLATGMIAGGGALGAAGVLGETGPLAFLFSYGPVHAVSQAVFAIATHTLARENARLRIIQEGRTCPDGGGGRTSAAGPLLFKSLIVCAAAAALAMGLGAHRLIRSQTFAASAENHRELLDALVVNGHPASKGDDRAEAFVEALTRFDKSVPFVFDEEGRWRRWFSTDGAAAIAARIGREDTGTLVDEWGGLAVAWTSLPEGAIQVGVRLSSVGGEGFVYVIVALLFAAAFGSALVSMRLGGVMREAVGIRVDALDAVPATEPFDPGPAVTREMARLDAAIEEASRRYRGKLDASRSRVDSGKEARKEKARVFTSMSHDLKSPLNSVIGFTDLLLKGMDGDLGRDQRKTVQEIARESERLLVLISDILDTAKLDSGSFELYRTWIPSVEILTDCEAGARRLVATREVRFISRFEPGLPPVMVDKERLGRALMSILARFIDSMNVGSVQLRASRERSREGDTRHLVVEIADIGSDMDEEHRRRIEATLALGTGKDAEGPGQSDEMELGLSLAGRILELHGGSLELGRDNDGSLTVRTRIPLDDPGT